MASAAFFPIEIFPTIELRCLLPVCMQRNNPLRPAVSRGRRTATQVYRVAASMFVRKDSRVNHARAWRMSAVYWGIVVGLVVMVATLFVCIGILSSKEKGSPQEPRKIPGKPDEAITHIPVNHRHAA